MKPSIFVRHGLALCVVLGLCLLAGPPARAADGSGSWTTLADSVPALVLKGKVTPAFAPQEAATIPIAITFKMRNADAFAARTAAAHDRTAPTFGKQVSDVEYERDYAPDIARYDAADRFLQSAGLNITYRDPHRLVLTAEGPQSAIAAAFRTTFGYFHAPDGRVTYANTTAAAIPTAFADSVSGVVGLSDLVQPDKPMISHTTPMAAPAVAPNAGCSTSGPKGDAAYSIRDAETGYNLDDLYNRGLNGAGTTVGIILSARFSQSHLNTFSSDYCLPPIVPTVVDVSDGNPLGGAADEADLDTQMVHGAAPGAAITFFLKANGAVATLKALSIVATRKNLAAVSMSFGYCEGALIDGLGTNYLDAAHNAIALADTNGTAILASSGDSGLYECENEGIDTGRQSADEWIAGDVNWPASDPLVTAVGGSSLYLSSASPRRWAGDNGWGCDPNDSRGYAACLQDAKGYPHGASGGGISDHFSMLARQQVIPYLQDIHATKRATPDISLDADPQTGVSFITSFPDRNGQLQTAYVSAGGTSASSPFLAGVIACATQRAGLLFGSLNYFLYDGPANGSRFWLYDVTTGYNGAQARTHNDADKRTGFFRDARTGYDLVTGLGSLYDASAFSYALWAYGTQFYDPLFFATWNGVDRAVAQGKASYSWVFGPTPQKAVYESYAESPEGERLVQYFDKARMEATLRPDNANAVTAGLLTDELVSGLLQQGDASFVPRSPAQIPVAGDNDDTQGPVYASFRNLATLPGSLKPVPQNGGAVTASIARDGTVGVATNLPRTPINSYYIKETGHNIPDVFINWLNGRGNWIATLGFPITEAYWATVKVGGVRKPVLMQLYERRVLTFTPGNAAQYQIEYGNIGQHYYLWRYGQKLTQ